MAKILQFIEFGLSPAAFLVLLVYHGWLFRRIRRNPMGTSQGLAKRTRRLWVQTMIDGRHDILAIQTLRNWTMSATFLASAAVLIGLGVLNIAITADKQGALSSALMSDFGSGSPELWLAKLILLSADFLFAFFNFTLAVRYYNHTGFMINLPMGQGVESDNVVEMLDRGGNHYSLGMRGYYLAIPLALWFFGPLWFLSGSLLLTLLLYRVDRGYSYRRNAEV